MKLINTFRSQEEWGFGDCQICHMRISSFFKLYAPPSSNLQSANGLSVCEEEDNGGERDPLV